MYESVWFATTILTLQTMMSDPLRGILDPNWVWKSNRVSPSFIQKIHWMITSTINESYFLSMVFYPIRSNPSQPRILRLAPLRKFLLEEFNTYQAAWVASLDLWMISWGSSLFLRIRKGQRYIKIIEGSLEVKLPTIWTVEKQRWEESEEKRSEERRCRCAKR